MRIAKKIRLLAICLVVITSAGIAGTAYWGYKTILNGLQVESLERQGEASEDRLSFAFSEITHDIQLLAGLPVARRILENHQAQSPDKDHLASIFSQMLQSKPYYAQVRLIGIADEGRESVRLDRVNGEIVRTLPPSLQQKGDRPYFQETLNLSKGGVYYSKINLNQEFGRIEVPHRSMFRAAMPILNSAKSAIGVVVINLDFQPFAEKFLTPSTDRYTHYLTNEAGDYLVNPDSSRIFGFDLGQIFRAQLDFPELTGFFENEKQEITFRTTASEGLQEQLVHFRKLKPFSTDRELSLGFVARFDDIGQATNSIAIQALAIAAILLALGSLFAVALSNRLTRPIENIASATEALGAGKSNVTLPTQRDDELGELARSFQSMRTTLQRHESELVSANTQLKEANYDLEHFAHTASHDLREPIRRIDALVNLIRLYQEEGDSSQLGALTSKLNTECKRAMQQISDFRVFAQISEETLHRTTVEPESIVRELLLDFEEIRDSTNASVTIDPLPTVNAYPSLLKMIYRNLIENAFKYAERPTFELRFTAEEKEGVVVLGVRNTGSSISAEHHHSVFNLFTQLKANSDGSGTGLSICRRAVDRHSGKIWLNSDSDYVHFKFTLNNNDSEN